MGISCGFHGVALSSTVSRSNWNLEMLVFVEGGKPEYPEKNPRSKDKNQQQTQATYDAETGNRTRATLVRGECSHHCAIPRSTVQSTLRESTVESCNSFPCPVAHTKKSARKRERMQRQSSSAESNKNGFYLEALWLTLQLSPSE